MFIKKVHLLKFLIEHLSNYSKTFLKGGLLAYIHAVHMQISIYTYICAMAKPGKCKEKSSAMKGQSKVCIFKV